MRFYKKKKYEISGDVKIQNEEQNVQFNKCIIVDEK